MPARHRSSWRDQAPKVFSALRRQYTILKKAFDREPLSRSHTDTGF